MREQEVENIKGQLDKLQVALEVADENGLFKNDSTSYFTVLNYIMDGLRNLSQNPPNVIDARKNFSLAYFNFNKAVNSSTAWWQFKYSHGGHIAIYLVALAIAPILAWIFYESILLQLELLWVPSWAYLWGLVDGALQGLWWLWQHISDRKLRKTWLVWFFLLPITGAILGALTYLIFITGLIAATNQTRLGSPYFLILLSALAGFSSRWAVQLLDKLTTIIRVG